MSALLPALLLLLFFQSEPQKIPSELSDAELSTVVITLERQGGGNFSFEDPTDLRNSPFYSVEVRGDGTVRYEGTAGVRTIGRRTHQIEVAAVRALLDAFPEADFFALSQRYTSVSRGDLSRSVTEQDKVVTSLAIAGVARSVFDEYGAPIALQRLENRIDDLSDCRRYTGRAPAVRPDGLVRGTVIDDAGAPVQGVQVRLLGKWVYEEVTDTDGTFMFHGVEPDSYWTTLRRDGYFPDNGDLMVRPKEPAVEWTPTISRIPADDHLPELERRLREVGGSETVACGVHRVFKRKGTWTTLSQGAVYPSWLCAMGVVQGGASTRWMGLQRPGDTWIVDGLYNAGGGARFRFSFDASKPEDGLHLTFCASPQLTSNSTDGRVLIGCS